MLRRLTRRDHHDHLEEISRQLVRNQRIFWRWLKNVRGQSAGIPNLKYKVSLFKVIGETVMPNQDGFGRLNWKLNSIMITE